MRRFNWRLWSGLALSVIAFLSYYMFFARFPVTRDFPWASLLIFAVAIALLVGGWRRAPRKILASVASILGIGVFVLFSYLVFIGSKQIPAAANAPAVGQKAPDFTLTDMNGKPVRLSDAVSQSNGVLLIFYRGYW